MTEQIETVYALEFLTEQGEVMVVDLHADGHYVQYIPDRSIDFVDPDPYTIAISLRLSDTGGAVMYRTIGEIRHDSGDGQLAYEGVAQLLADGAQELYASIQQYVASAGKEQDERSQGG